MNMAKSVPWVLGELRATKGSPPVVITVRADVAGLEPGVKLEGVKMN